MNITKDKKKYKLVFNDGMTKCLSCFQYNELVNYFEKQMHRLYRTEEKNDKKV